MLILGLLLVLVLVLLNGVVAMSEIASVSFRKAKLAPLADGRQHGAARALALTAEPTKFAWRWTLLFLLFPAQSAYADVTLLLQEPYGRFGSFNPTGHSAVYLSRVCTDSPTVLRRCRSGETGVVISRYYRVAGLDWVAIPLIPYLYAVDRSSDVPIFADAAQVATLRDQYRRRHLANLIPDRPDGQMPPGEWIELVGAAYDRRITAFTVPSTEAQDDALIQELNARTNRRRFNLLFRNCADFARDIVNLYYPKALNTSLVADLGITTPKQLAKSLVRYSDRRHELELVGWTIPQVPGSRRDSRGTRGVLEAFVKSKKYLVPLVVLQPWIPAGMAAGYVVKGRFNAARYGSIEYGPVELEERALLAAMGR